jgi:hypothetical protein
MFIVINSGQSGTTLPVKLPGVGVFRFVPLDDERYISGDLTINSLFM